MMSSAWPTECLSFPDPVFPADWSPSTRLPNPKLRHRPAPRDGPSLREAFNAGGARMSSEAHTCILFTTAPDMYPDEEDIITASSLSRTSSTSSTSSSSSSSTAPSSTRQLGHKHSSASMITHQSTWHEEFLDKIEYVPFEFTAKESSKPTGRKTKTDGWAPVTGEVDFIPLTEEECARWREKGEESE